VGYAHADSNGRFGFFMIGCLSFWPMAAAFTLLLTPAQSWAYVGTVSGIAIGWPLAFAIAWMGVTCDPAMLIWSPAMLVMLLPAGLLENPKLLLLTCAGLAIIAALSFALYRLIRRPISRWAILATVVSFPIVVLVSAACLSIGGAHPEPGNCVL
jgi:hypothetical protein